MIKGIVLYFCTALLSLDTPHSAVSVVGSASCSLSTESNINKLKKFLWKCCLSPVHHAMLSHSPWGSAEPFTTFLTFFMPSITPEVVTLEEKREASAIRPWTAKSISATAHTHQTTFLTSLYPHWAVSMFDLLYHPDTAQMGTGSTATVLEHLKALPSHH